MSIDFSQWLNKTVTYISSSGKRYQAWVTAIPENPSHGYTDKPTVTLAFKDTSGKLVVKTRVLPCELGHFTSKCWVER